MQYTYLALSSYHLRRKLYNQHWTQVKGVWQGQGRIYYMEIIILTLCEEPTWKVSLSCFHTNYLLNLKCTLLVFSSDMNTEMFFGVLEVDNTGKITGEC